MSDDGYYYALDDDLEDILYDADPAPDLAEDLAEHTVHSPVYQEDASYDFLDYYSDWEYYSDDYYDDDPSLLKHHTVAGSPPEKESGTDADLLQQKRGRKRKLNQNVSSTGDEVLRPTLRESVRGTVWKKKLPPSPGWYQAGANESVALLKNWQDVFGAEGEDGIRTHTTFGRGQLQSDESWANDMSLEDVGLHTARGSAREENVEGQNVTLAEDEEEFDEEAEDEANAFEDDITPSGAPESVGLKPIPVVDGSSETPPLSPTPRKRTKLTGLPSPPTPRLLKVPEGNIAQQQNVHAPLQPHATDQTPQTGEDEEPVGDSADRKDRKRKASEHLEDDSEELTARSTRKGRAKRIASVQGHVNQDEVKVEGGGPSKRTRNRLK